MEEAVTLYSEESHKLAKKTVRAGNRLLLWIPIILAINLIIFELLGIKGFDDVITLLGFVGLPLLYTLLKLEGNFKTVFKLNPLNLKAILPLVLITLAMQPISTFLFMISTALFGNHMETLFKEILTQGPLMLFITLCIVPAIGEEFIMRGIVLHLYSPMKSYAQILINGFLFGIFHQNLNQFSYSCFIGMILALAVILTKSIWSGVIIHFLNNFISYLEFEFNFTLFNDGVNQPMNWIVIIGLAIVGGFLLYKLFIWLNGIYREEEIEDYLDKKDEQWVVANNCKKLSWTSMWTVSMWLNVVIFIAFSVIIIMDAAKMLN